MHVDELSKANLMENQTVVNDLMNKVEELLCEINGMYDPRDFKDAESVRSGTFSHVPS